VTRGAIEEDGSLKNSNVNLTEVVLSSTNCNVTDFEIYCPKFFCQNYTCTI